VASRQQAHRVRLLAVRTSLPFLLFLGRTRIAAFLGRARIAAVFGGAGIAVVFGGTGVRSLCGAGVAALRGMAGVVGGELNRCLGLCRCNGKCREAGQNRRRANDGQ